MMLDQRSLPQSDRGDETVNQLQPVGLLTKTQGEAHSELDGSVLLFFDGVSVAVLPKVCRPVFSSSETLSPSEIISLTQNYKSGADMNSLSH